MGKDPRTDIILALMNVDEPVGLARVARDSRLSIQHADYWIGRLMDEGAVLCVDEGQQHRYFLQPIFYDKKFAQRFDSVFDDLYKIVEKNLEVVSGTERQKAAFTVINDILHVIMNSKRF